MPRAEAKSTGISRLAPRSSRRYNDRPLDRVVQRPCSKCVVAPAVPVNGSLNRHFPFIEPRAAIVPRRTDRFK